MKMLSIPPNALAPSSHKPKLALMSHAPVCPVSTEGSGFISSCGSPAANGGLGARRRTHVFSALWQKAVDRQWSRARQDESRKACEVKEIGFKARRPELCAGGRHSLELDRTEPVRQMHGKRGDEEDSRHRYTGQRHQCT